MLVDGQVDKWMNEQVFISNKWTRTSIKCLILFYLLLPKI